MNIVSISDTYPSEHLRNSSTFRKSYLQHLHLRKKSSSTSPHAMLSTTSLILSLLSFHPTTSSLYTANKHQTPEQETSTPFPPLPHLPYYSPLISPHEVLTFLLSTSSYNSILHKIPNNFSTAVVDPAALDEKVVPFYFSLPVKKRTISPSCKSVKLQFVCYQARQTIFNHHPKNSFNVAF